MERERASSAVLARYHCRRPSLHIVILPYMLLLSSSAGHLTCGGLAVVIWWGPCRLSVIGHPPLHLSSSSVIVVVARGGKAREVGDIVHPPRRGVIIVIIVVIVIIWWGHHRRPSPPLCVVGHPREASSLSSFPTCRHHCRLSPTLRCLVRASSSIIVIGTRRKFASPGSCDFHAEPCHMPCHTLHPSSACETRRKTKVSHASATIPTQKKR